MITQGGVLGETPPSRGRHTHLLCVMAESVDEVTARLGGINMQGPTSFETERRGTYRANVL